MSKTMALMCLLATGSLAWAQTSAPATQLVLPEGPLQVTVTGVDGIVRLRPTPTDKWVRAAIGMVLNEGAEFQTGPRSAVRFVIPPDQTVSLDRLGTVKILRANFENGKLFTDLGMKYGRTRYDIESAGRDHDAKVHSPSAVMAIRGTTVSLYDQPPFTPEAVSLTGRARFIVGNKVIPFGGKGQGKTKVNQSSNSPAETALSLTEIDPKGLFSGRTQNDLAFQLALAAYGGSDFSNLGVLSFLGKPGTVIGTLPIQEQLLINMTFADSAQEAAVLPDANLTITDPLGQVLSAATPTTPDGGILRGKTFDAQTNTGQINADWSISFPAGKYTFTESLANGPGVGVATTLQITDLNPNTGASTTVGPIPATLVATSPTFTYTNTFPKPLQAGTVVTPARQSRR
jgi:hypothetical protein